MKKYRFLLWVTFWGYTCAYAQPTSRDSVRITNLEKRVAVLQDSLKVYAEKQNQVGAFIANIQKAVAEPWWMIVTKFGGVTLLLIGMVYLCIRAINYFSPNWYVQAIQRLVERYEGSNLLKRNKRLLLLNIHTANAENRHFIEGLLREFNVVETIDIENTYVAPKEKFDVVFANFETGFDKDKHQPILHQYISSEKHHGKSLFALIPPGAWNYVLDRELQKHVNIANVRAQVYGNLMSLLKYHDLSVPKM